MNTIIGRTTPQKTFGEMLKICFENNKPEENSDEMHQDTFKCTNATIFAQHLYLDALWLKDHFEKACAKGGFYWSLRTCGTLISLHSSNDVISDATDEVIYFVKLENV